MQCSERCGYWDQQAEWRQHLQVLTAAALVLLASARCSSSSGRISRGAIRSAGIALQQQRSVGVLVVGLIFAGGGHVSRGAAASNAVCTYSVWRTRWIGRCISVCRHSCRLVGTLSVPAGTRAACLYIQRVNALGGSGGVSASAGVELLPGRYFQYQQARRSSAVCRGSSGSGTWQLPVLARRGGACSPLLARRTCAGEERRVVWTWMGRREMLSRRLRVRGGAGKVILHGREASCEAPRDSLVAFKADGGGGMRCTSTSWERTILLAGW